jgi:hypothetical protein
MHRPRLPLATLILAFAGCTDSTTPDPDDVDDVTTVAAQDLSAPDGCRSLIAIARPIAAPQFHDPALQQTAGKLTMRIGRGAIRTGTTLATIVGQAADGTPLGNHDWLFADAGFRTRNDRLQLTPTADPCVVDVASEIYIVEGSGAYAGLTGTVDAAGVVDFCGAEGRIVISGHVCAGGAR